MGEAGSKQKRSNFLLMMFQGMWSEGGKLMVNSQTN